MRLPADTGARSEPVIARGKERVTVFERHEMTKRFGLFVNNPEEEDKVPGSDDSGLYFENRRTEN